MVTGDEGHDVFTQVRALLMEVKPYCCLFVCIESLLRSDRRYQTERGVFLVFPMSRTGRTSSTLRLGLLLYFQGVTHRWQGRLEG